MSSMNDWKHRWFGVWAELGGSYSRCPSIADFVNPQLNARYDKVRMRHYITTAPIVASASRQAFPDVITGERHAGGVSFRTDGEWLWLDDLADYIDHHGVVIPSEWLNAMEARGFEPPSEVPQGAIARLEWPPVT